MTKFDKLTEAYINKVVLRETDESNRGSGLALDIYLRRTEDIRSVKQQLMKGLHHAIMGAQGPEGDNDTEDLVASSANLIPYKRSNENDSPVLELTVTGVKDMELLKTTLAKVVGNRFKYDLYPV